ncbi:MAG: UDP-N-acetylglucosamine--N-acetylmuramyl-(pentapeptide) pyrophosphoryl-undecaprenol N-acetylglucosamine transferase [Acidimicrobiales bacterium]
MSVRRFAIVTAGGTGGHVLPALEVARAVVGRGHAPETIEIVGSSRGKDLVALEGEGFATTFLPGRGLTRKGGVGATLKNARSIVSLAWASALQVVRFLNNRPKVVVTVGGYASFPAGAAAVLLGVPTVVVSVDVVPGLANRLLGRFASANAVAFPGSHLARAVVTGTPIRKEILSVERSKEASIEALEVLGLPRGRKTVAVFGGSLGSLRINEAVTDLVDAWSGREDLSIYHVVGKRDWEELSRKFADDDEPPRSKIFYRAVPFETRMELLYAAADLFLCRAGGMTVAELAAVGCPAVLVPLPGAPGDHQTANANVLRAAGGAVVLRDDLCDAEHLARLIDEMFDSPRKLDSMGKAAKSLGCSDAADRIAELVERVARGERREVLVGDS